MVRLVKGKCVNQRQSREIAAGSVVCYRSGCVLHALVLIGITLPIFQYRFGKSGRVHNVEVPAYYFPFFSLYQFGSKWVRTVGILTSVTDHRSLYRA